MWSTAFNPGLTINTGTGISSHRNASINAKVQLSPPNEGIWLRSDPVASRCWTDESNSNFSLLQQHNLTHVWETQERASKGSAGSWRVSSSTIKTQQLKGKARFLRASRKCCKAFEVIVLEKYNLWNIRWKLVPWREGLRFELNDAELKTIYPLHVPLPLFSY